MARRQLERGYDSDSSGEGAYDSDGEARVSENESEPELGAETGFNNDLELDELDDVVPSVFSGNQTLAQVGKDEDEDEDEDLFASEDEDQDNELEPKNGHQKNDISTSSNIDNNHNNDNGYNANGGGNEDIDGDDDGPPIAAFKADFSSESENDGSEKDGWEYDNQDVVSAAQAHHKQEQESLLREQVLRDELQSENPIELVETLISMLEPSETPMEALARFGPLKRAKKKKARNRALELELDLDQQEIVRKQQVNQLTELCNKLERFGLDSIYDMSREELMRFYRKHGGKETPRGVKRTRLDDESNDTNDYYDLKQWEFKWSADDEILGPYSSYEMDYWKEQGHFNTSSNNDNNNDTSENSSVVVRRIGGPFVSINSMSDFKL